LLKSQDVNDFRRIEADLNADEGLQNIRTVLLYGSEGLLSEHYARKLTAVFVAPSALLLDYVKFDGAEAAADDIVAACDTLPMVSLRRVVEVSGMPGDEKSLAAGVWPTLTAYLPQIPETTLLILTADSFSKRSALYKAVSAQGRAYAFGRLDRTDLKAFIRKRFKEMGLLAEAKVVDAVIEASGYFDRTSQASLFNIDGDVRRVAAYAADTGHVSLSDVSACMDTSDEADVFALLDAASSGRKDAALELLANAAEKGENTFRLLALLTGQFEIMLGYREMKAEGYALPEMMKALGVKSDYRMKKAAAAAARYEIPQLMRLLDRLYRVEADIKSGLYGERLALAMFVAEM
jgi:DNA polymerase-3 subunit delta